MVAWLQDLDSAILLAPSSVRAHHLRGNVLVALRRPQASTVVFCCSSGLGGVSMAGHPPCAAVVSAGGSGGMDTSPFCSHNGDRD